MSKLSSIKKTIEYFRYNDNTDNVAFVTYGEADRSSESEIRTQPHDKRRVFDDNIDNLRANQLPCALKENKYTTTLKTTARTTCFARNNSASDKRRVLKTILDNYFLINIKQKHIATRREKREYDHRYYRWNRKR